MPQQNQDVLKITKILYDEMYQYFQSNYIGEQERLNHFVEDNIQPLYPSKPVDDIDDLRGSDIVTKVPQKTYRENLNRKTSLAQFTEFELESMSQTQISDKSQVIYTNVIRRYKMKELCLSLGTGNFFCWGTSQPDKVYEDMGLSTCLYLKFIKHYIYSLLIISPLIIFMLVTFYLTALDNEINPGTNYKKFLFSFSIGTLSLQQINCKQHKILPNTQSINANLYCATGHVKLLGPIYTQTLFESLQNCRTDMDNYIYREKQFILRQNYQQTHNCKGETNVCQYNISIQKIKPQYKKVSITYECINGKLDLGALQIKRSSLFYITIAFDLTSIVIMCLFLWSQIGSQNKEEKYFKDKQFLLNAFSFQLGPFSIRNWEEQLIQFIEFIEGKCKSSKYKISIKNIVQIRFPDDPQFTNHQQKRKKVYNKIYELIGCHFLKENFNPYLYLNQKDFKQNCFKSQKEYGKYRMKLYKLVYEYNQCQNMKKTNYDGEIYIYFVFEKPKYKRIIVENSNMGKIKINNKEYEIREITSPELMLWDNNFKYKLPRIIISYVITFVTWFGSYVLLAFIWSLRKRPMKSYNFDVDCTTLYKNQNFDIYNEVLRNSDDTATYLHCYCSNNSFLSINSEKLCEDWSIRYFEYLIIPLFFSTTIIGLNIVLSIFYKKLSEFQAYHKATSQLYSYILKKTFLLILLLAIVIISLSLQQNVKTDAFQFLYEGTYNDITVDWYQQIGSIIIITLCFNIITPFIEVLLYFGKRAYIKIRIFMFKKSPNYKKLKHSYMEFYKTDVFPIEERYAQLLAVSAICVSLSCVCPLMIIVLIVELTFFAMIDKILIIKAYHKPINFEQKLHKKVIYSFFIIILLHLIVTAILLTEKYILVAGNNSNNFSVADENMGRISAIFATSYIIPYMTIFFLLLSSTLIVAISRLFYFSKPNKSLNIGKDGIPFEQHRYYNLLNSYELNKTIKLKQREWNTIKIMQENYFYKEQNKTSKNPSSESQLDSGQRMLILPSSATLIPQSSKYLELSCVQQPQQLSASQQQIPSSNQQKNPIKTETSISNGPILKKIIKYCFYKLQNKKQKNEKDKMRLTQLVGMSTYEHYDDWIFLEDHVKVDYKIQGL